MTQDKRLVAKGRAEPRDGLTQQGKVHLGLAQKYATELDDAGWSPADTKELTANVARLEQAVGAQSQAYDHASHTSVGESQAVDEAKAYIRKLRNALPRTLREATASELTMDAFHAGETLGRSTPKITTYLSTIRPAVVKLDQELAKHFKGQKASALLDVAKEALDKADKAQELARQDAPGETLSLYEVMGKVLEQIEDLNRAAKIAFDGDAATRSKFNKDILIRARKEQAKKPEEDSAASGAAQPT